MTPEEFDQLADNPNPIEGIYNWCDRWCERRSFTSRCLNYAIGEKQGTTNVNDLSNVKIPMVRQKLPSSRLTVRWQPGSSCCVPFPSVRQKRFIYWSTLINYGAP